jgi:hypothetical protein
MTIKHESKTGNGHRKYDLMALLGKAQRHVLDPRLPEEAEEEMFDSYWGTTESYRETYLNIPRRS